jgi:hypothetical protein
MGSKTLKITMGILLVVRFAASVASLARGTKKFALPKNDAYRRKAGGKSNPGTDTFSQNTSSASSGLSWPRQNDSGNRPNRNAGDHLLVERPRCPELVGAERASSLQYQGGSHLRRHVSILVSRKPAKDGAMSCSQCFAKKSAATMLRNSLLMPIDSTNLSSRG